MYIVIVYIYSTVFMCMSPTFASDPPPEETTAILRKFDQ